MTAPYTHCGNINDMPDDAPPALQFLKSLTAALDGTSRASRSNHMSPTATVVTNGSEPLLFSALEPMFDKRVQMVSRFFHTLKRAWVLPTSPSLSATSVTIFIDWTSTTEFKSSPGKVAVVSEFCVIKVGPADASRDGGYANGVNGLWVESIENWLDPSPVKDLQIEISKEEQR